MDYQQINVACPVDQNDLLIALLSEQPFDTFEETETGFSAYLPAKNWTAEIEKAIHDLSQQFDFQFDTHFIKYQNWNAVWESNFQAMQVDDFCGIRADFHDPIVGVAHEIIINPKMAFGTGHHETTYMVMQLMRNFEFEGRKVFDFGCGTGILAILAAKLGATWIDAVDIEQPSYENTIENSAINGIKCSANAPYKGIINAFHGVLNDVPTAQYDCILANINRNVILPSLPTLRERLLSTGNLLISGFLVEDEQLLSEAATANHFVIKHTERRGKWLCMHLVCE